jgi:hypothetical protein
MMKRILLACCITASATFAGQKFDFEQFRDRLPWIWQTPRQGEPPKVQDSAWPADPVDRFVPRKLEAVKLRPTEPTNDRVWIRRVHFAITGLPPKPKDVQAFLNDKSKNRNRTLVRALLNSPHYGERWARHWMDLVRYAESRGHEGDAILPNAYRYRDYLIRAFNADLPYDALVTEHLAGDLLENPRLHPETGANESIHATGWPFFGEELGTPMDLRQDECDRLDNKVDVMSKTFLGLTVACARCHDHKFDAEYKHTQTYARECLIARRLIERGVRFVELTIPKVNGYQSWDAHNDLVTNHSTNARAVDQPIAGLIRDLKSRGLLDETLVVWSGEFGRTPFAQGGKGRDHNEYGFSLWMAGGGIKPGVTYGSTDDWGYKAVDKPLQIHDLHATMLYLLGIDHEELTYRFSGRDIRLTDVHGQVIEDILL